MGQNNQLLSLSIKGQNNFTMVTNLFQYLKRIESAPTHNSEGGEKMKGLEMIQIMGEQAKLLAAWNERNIGREPEQARKNIETLIRIFHVVHRS